MGHINPSYLYTHMEEVYDIYIRITFTNIIYYIQQYKSICILYKYKLFRKA